MRLEEKLRRAKAASHGKIPEEARQVMGRHTAELERRDRAAEALGVGDRAPDFTLPATTDGDWSLADRRKRGPVILSFYRGRW